MSKLSSRGAAWEAVRQAVLDRDAWTCTACGKPLIGDDATVDHIIPKNLGGTDDPWNLTSMCRRDNGMKQDRELVRLPGYNPRWLSGPP